MSALNETVMKVAQSLSDKRDDHMMETGHTRFTLPEIRPIDIIEGMKFEFVQYCGDCREENYQ